MLLLNNIVAQIEKSINAINCLTDEQDHHWFSNPTNVTDLPYPSTVYKIADGLDVFNDSDGTRRFTYMSRKVFLEVYDAVNFILQDSDSTSLERETLNLYGPLGAGKSHVLAALACLFIREGKDVIYIPSCRFLTMGEPTTLVKELLSFSFPELQEAISAINNLENLLNFLLEFDKGSIICIVDGTNELQHVSGDPPERSRYKQMANSIIRIFFANQILLCSAPSRITSYVLSTHRPSGKSQNTRENMKSSFAICGMTQVCDYMLVIS